MQGWNRLLGVSTRRPGPVVALAAVSVLALAPGLFRLQMRMDGWALVPHGAPEVDLDAGIRRDFGLLDPVVIRLRSGHPDGIFEPVILRRLVDLTAGLASHPGLAGARITSLATETGDRFVPGSLDLRRFLEPFPETPAAFAELRDDLRALRLYHGTLVAFDERSTAILVGLPAATDRATAYSAIRDVLATNSLPPEDVDVLGAPLAESLLGLHILSDLGVPIGSGWEGILRSRRIGLLPLVLVVVGAIFGFAFRSPAAVALPLVQMGSTLVVVLGAMGYLGVPIYLTMAVLPVILCVMGITDDIHFFARLRRRRSEHAEPARDSVGATLASLARPMTMTSLTTAAGFLSFALSPLPPVAAFGLCTAAGILYSLLWSLFVIPSLLVRWPLPAAAAPQRGRTWGRFACSVAERRRLIVPLVLVLGAAIPAGIARLRVQDGWIEGFAPESPFRRATHDFEEQFFGSHVLHVVAGKAATRLVGAVAAADVHDHWIDLPRGAASDTASLAGAWVTLGHRGAPPPDAPLPAWKGWVRHASHVGDTLVLATVMSFGSPRFGLQAAASDTLAYEIEARPWLTPAMLAWSDSLGEFVRGRKTAGVGGVLGPIDYLATTSFIVGRRAPGTRDLPEDPSRIEWLWQQYGRVRGPDRLREILDEDLERGVMSVYLENANFRSTAQLMRDIRAWHDMHPGPPGTHLDFAGDVAVSQTLIEAIVTTQVRSLGLTLAVVLLVTSLFLRSFRWGLVCVVPCALAVAGCFAVMGFGGIPLGVATSMFAAMVVGIGVDYAIHAVTRFRAARTQGAPPLQALAQAYDATGPAIGVDALAVGAGFGLLAVSSVPANARLGILVLACIGMAFAATCALLPLLLVHRGGAPLNGRLRDGSP